MFDNLNAKICEKKKKKTVVTKNAIKPKPFEIFHSKVNKTLLKPVPICKIIFKFALFSFL